MPRPAKPKPGKDQLSHYDPQQCSPADRPEYAGEHVHDLCKCDPDAVRDPDARHIGMGGDQPWNTRAHIKQDLDGHWPLTPGQDVVICERCGGAIPKTSTHKAALSYQGLAAKT